MDKVSSWIEFKRNLLQSDFMGSETHYKAILWVYWKKWFLWAEFKRNPLQIDFMGSGKSNETWFYELRCKKIQYKVHF